MTKSAVDISAFSFAKRQRPEQAEEWRYFRVGQS